MPFLCVMPLLLCWHRKDKMLKCCEEVAGARKLLQFALLALNTRKMSEMSCTNSLDISYF